MKHIHMTHCLLGMGVVVALLLAFGVQAGTVFAVCVALMCPFMMVFGMGYLFHRGRAHHAGEPEDAEVERTTRAA